MEQFILTSVGCLLQEEEVVKKGAKSADFKTLGFLFCSSGAKTRPDDMPTWACFTEVGHPSAGAKGQLIKSKLNDNLALLGRGKVSRIGPIMGYRIAVHTRTGPS